MAPVKRRQKDDDDDSDILYADDNDLDDNTTYQTYKPKPSCSRKQAPASSLAKKRKV